MMLRGFLVFLLAVVSQAAFAQSGYPNRTVRVIVPFPAGGSNDVLCRILGEKFSAK